MRSTGLHHRLWCAVAVLVMAAPAQGQVSPSLYDFARGSLSWHTIETPHFNVHFHTDDSGHSSERSARAVADIAERIYGPITELYGHEPDSKVAIILRDFEDYSNGAAYFFDNMIQLWAPSLDTPLRGDHDWLWNVVTHEFTHIIQVQATMKASRHLPFLYFQLLSYEDVRRPDVLYGYPNGIVTYPIPVLNNPAWLAEGTAQYQRTRFAYDTWDSHRDMLLRTRILAGTELSLEDMGGFYSHNSLEREGVYNQGFAFTQYIAREFGEGSLSDLSRALGSWRSLNFNRAAKRSLGVSGKELYRAWIDSLRVGYQSAAENVLIAERSGDVIQEEGFLNLQPRFSPDGRRWAYLSNKGGDFSRTALYVMDESQGQDPVAILDASDTSPMASYVCSMGHRVSPAAYAGFAWSPDSRRIAYARRNDTAEGYYFADLYEYDLELKRAARLTTSLRARSPAYSPDGKRIAFISERDGTGNLYILHRPTSDGPARDPAGAGQVRQITLLDDGEQLADPVWSPDGSMVYVTASLGRGRGIYRVDVVDGTLLPFVDTPADERNPARDASGEHLYFSSDASGIFNIYRVPIERPSEIQPVTNVLGGAFWPDVDSSGNLIYSHYEWDGYKIARIEGVDSQTAPRILPYSPPAVLTKWQGDREEVVAGGSEHAPTSVGVGTKRGSLATDEPASDTLSVGDYGSDFTAFSFFPVLRLDQYVTRRRGRAEVRLRNRTRAETLARNTKLGFYVASREVLDGLSLLGGLLVGPTSGDAESIGDFFAPASLLDLERDLFILFEYKKGLLFRDKKWSPQLSLQLFNIRRNVENGLAFEELACTACFPPDTTLADLSYNLWELDLAARSKISRNLLLEAGYRFSPYRVTTERFFSREFQQTIDASSSRYFIGRAIRLKAYLEALRPHRHSDVVPDGIQAELTYEFEPGRLLDRFEVEDGILSPKYNKFRNHRLTLDLRYGRALKVAPATHGIGVRARASTILGKSVDNFFDDYVGGLIGARGYPFYALGGNETVWLQVSYHLPLLPSIRRQLWFLYLDKIYARLYGDAAYAWSGSFPGVSDAKRDVGAELRVGVGSFYLLPTAIFVSATYGLDEFEFKLDEDFVTPDGSSSVFYGRDIQWHFGILFGFDL